MNANPFVYVPAKEECYVGLTRDDDTGELVFANGMTLAESDLNPNDIKNFGDNNKDCVAVNKDGKFKLKRCDHNKCVLCTSP